MTGKLQKASLKGQKVCEDWVGSKRIATWRKIHCLWKRLVRNYGGIARTPSGLSRKLWKNQIGNLQWIHTVEEIFYTTRKIQFIIVAGFSSRTVLCFLHFLPPSFLSLNSTFATKGYIAPTSTRCL